MQVAPRGSRTPNGNAGGIPAAHVVAVQKRDVDAEPRRRVRRAPQARSWRACTPATMLPTGR
jgi:hypothetical protein